MIPNINFITIFFENFNIGGKCNQGNKIFFYNQTCKLRNIALLHKKFIFLF